MAVVNTTDWNCTPQPAAPPAARTAIVAAPMLQNATMTPRQYSAASRLMCARPVPESLAMATAFIASTGSTHGIRLRISPPANASRSASTSPVACLAPASMPAGRAPGVAAICNAVFSPPLSVIARTPDSPAPASSGFNGFSFSVNTPPLTATGCTAPWSTIPGVSGKKYASFTGSPMPDSQSVPSGAMCAGKGDSLGVCASAAANSAACFPSAPEPAGTSR